ncbi:MAG: SPOR domain-containing protein [Bacteroidetes bacterium]|nr:SPOR domain-containing protein [Cryomorphaceae bacterium]MBL6677686.1 SPOR domain-containing protein [Flavobacteriaceae bacterium]MDA0885370.1 SPOR domain-containing protein [Bacteroidota bacterium]MDA2947244.1 SPOR domain-containing protein [Actinomycetota bacterium]
MTIFKEIYDLLYNNDCVIVPKFGAFVLRSHPAYIKDDNFYPPKKIISFNAMLDENDGLLVKHLSTSRNISYKKALKIINDETDSLKNKLSIDKKIKIDRIGDIELSSENNLVFHPNELINFDSNSFGLSSFSKEPILKSVKRDVAPKTEPAKNPVLRYAVIFLALIGFGYFGYFNYLYYLDNERIKNIAIAQDQILQNVQSATFNIGELPTINLKVTAPVENINKTYFSVIAGSFRSKVNAEKHLNYLINKGFKASYTAENPNGLFRVAYARLESRKKAYSLIAEIKENGQDAWLLIED